MQSRWSERLQLNCFNQLQFTRKQGFVEGEPLIIELKEGERKTGIVLVAK